MKFRLVSLWVCLWVLAVIAAHAANDANNVGSADAAGFVALLSQSQHYSAEFEQTVQDLDGELLDQYSGSISLTRPGSLRWDIQQPMQQVLIVHDGLYYQYDADIDQLLIEPLSPQAAALPSILLSGDAALIEGEYQVKLEHEDSTSQVYSLMPKSDDALFTSVTVRFDRGNLQSLAIVDEMQQTSYFRFSVIDESRIDTGRYQLDVPEHTEIIKR